MANNIKLDEVAFVGNDLNDMDIMKKVHEFIILGLYPHMKLFQQF